MPEGFVPTALPEGFGKPGDPFDTRLWHFNGDLPLQCSDADDDVLVNSKWRKIEYDSSFEAM